MDRFPAELKLALFYVLPDVSTLSALRQTSSSFYRAFTDSHSMIVAAVLANEVHPAVISDAVALWDVMRLEPWNKPAIKSFLKRYRHSKPSPARSPWTLSEAIKFSKVHRHVQFFTNEFCSSVLSVHPITGKPDPEYGPPSSSELCRIQRVLYRFELYCVLFRIREPASKNKERFELEEQQALFFTKFRPWENEQLACIHDYLIRRLSVAFNELAEHDISWGELCINPTQPMMSENRFQEGYLSQGLGFLHRLVTAETYDDRYAALNPLKPSDHHFLHEGLREQGVDDVNGAFQRGEREEAPSYDIPALSANDDSGPIEAWCWANGAEIVYYENDQADLREWGYCLWDKARLEAWGLFYKPWTGRRAYERARRQHSEENSRSERLMKSREERSRIWMLGGTGWWDEGDESRIVWTCGTPAEQQKRAEDKKRAQGCRVHGPNGLYGRLDGVCPPGCLTREGERIRVGTSKGIDAST